MVPDSEVSPAPGAAGLNDEQSTAMINCPIDPGVFMNEYEHRAWEDIRGWRNRQPRVRFSRLVPKPVCDGTREVVRKGADAVRQVAGAAQFQRALSAALEGLLGARMDVGAASVPRSRAMRRLEKKGYG